MMIRSVIHFVFHLLVPAAVSRKVFKSHWQTAWLIMVLTNFVDLDHLMAVPVYNPNRCSIGFHPLHSYVAIGVYALMAAVPKLRVIAAGLIIHVSLDILDCIWIKWG